MRRPSGSSARDFAAGAGGLPPPTSSSPPLLAYSPSASNIAAVAAQKLPFTWPTSLPAILPHRLRRKLRSRVRNRQSPAAASVTALQTSFSPADTLQSLRRHQWSFYDGQYLILAVLGIFSLCMIQTPGPLVKTAVATIMISALCFPVSRQFLLPSLPIWMWLIWYYACGFIPSDWRPPIWVRVLPALENIFYGANLSNILSAHTTTFLSVMAWLPYGIVHFGAPAVCSFIIFIFAAPGTTPCFARSFGWMNLVGVAIQLTFPCSPPWYEKMYGLAPANYSMHGSPAGLAAIDELFGIALYTPGFTGSPMPFGAFPSLHAASAVMEALFMSHVFPRLTPLFVVYTCWLWWATMYLNHHYAVDLVGGSLLSAVIFFIAKSKWLPRQQLDKTFRWDYDYVEVGEDSTAVSGYRGSKGYMLADMDDPHNISPGSDGGDEWSLGSSSSYNSASGSASGGSRSPIDPELAEASWEGETLASHSDSEPR